MLATQVRQKDSRFYFVAYPAEDLLRRVRFISRYYGEGETLEAEAPRKDDEVGTFIARVERSDAAFQRQLARKKVRAIQDFYAEAVNQPPIPGAVLLFTSEELRFEPIGSFDNVGNLVEPRQPYLIIDGQHRLAALHFYREKFPAEAKGIHVPCVIFDGKTEDFATEMFVTINSTPTRINKSHLVDLYERVAYAAPDRKLAAKVCEMLYAQDDSPLQYKVNRLGGRSQQQKWILQAELFNEIHRWVRLEARRLKVKSLARSRDVDRVARADLFEPLRDFLNAVRTVLGNSWANDKYMVTRAVTLKALVRVCADLYRADPKPDDRVHRWAHKLRKLRELEADFRVEGFYERFPAKGQVERVARVHRRINQLLGITPIAAEHDGP
ncbi:MAG: DGQHR domain-containing protein [Candidatus Binatia bacterium]